MIIIVAAAIRNQYRPKNTEKPSASEYLKVEHIGSIGTFYNNNRTVDISELGLKITAIGGNATAILITDLPTANEEEYPYIDFLEQGTSKELTILIKSYVTSLNEEGLFPLDLTIGCNEAEPAEITIYLDPNDVVGPHY